MHGFNQTFNNAAEHMGQLIADLRAPPGSVFFSWPSDSGRIIQNISLTAINGAAYISARNIVIPTSMSLNDAIRSSSMYSPSFSFLAHSMGSEVLTQALMRRHREAQSAGEGDITPPRNIILAAPDVTVPDFLKERIASLPKTASRITIYCSDDKALEQAAQLEPREPRLGHCASLTETALPGLEIVEVTGAIKEYLRHSYFSNEAAVLDDLRQVLLAAPLASPQPQTRRKIEIK